jgi:glucose dehydrogenase
MGRPTLRWCVSLGAVAGGMVWIASAQQPKRVDDNALRNAAKNGDGWLTYGRDYAETRFSPLKQIDTQRQTPRLGVVMGNRVPFRGAS